MRFNPRVDLREGADRAGDGAGRDLLARRDQAGAGAGEFGIGLGELEPEGRRLGMDAVRAADGRRQLVLEGAALQRGEQRVDVGDKDVGGAGELHVEAGVEHVGRRHALMHEARLRPDDLGEMRQERDDVVLGLALDRVDARDVEDRVAALVPDRPRGRLRDDAELGHGVGGMRLDLEPDAEARLRRPRSRPSRAGCSAGSSPLPSADPLHVAKPTSLASRRAGLEAATARCHTSGRVAWPHEETPMQLQTLPTPLSHRDRNVAPVLIVLHATAGSTAKSSINHLRGIGLSYHYIIARDGRDSARFESNDGTDPIVFGCVPENGEAFHVASTIPVPNAGGIINKNSIGISLANIQRRTNPERYPAKQLKALDDVIAMVLQAHPSIKQLTTHAVVQPWNRADPRGVSGPAIAQRHGLTFWKPTDAQVAQHRPREG